MLMALTSIGKSSAADGAAFLPGLDLSAAAGLTFI